MLGRTSGSPVATASSRQSGVPGRPWTLAERRQLTQLRQRGASVAEVAQQLERTPRAVKHVVVELGASYQLSRRPWSAEEQATLTRLRLSGVSRAEIAVRLGRSEHAVKYKIGRMGPARRCQRCREPVSALTRSEAGPTCETCRSILERVHMPLRASLRARVADTSEALELDGPDGHPFQLLGRGGNGIVTVCGCGYSSATYRTRSAATADARSHLRRVERDPHREQRLIQLGQQVEDGTYKPPDEADWRERLGDTAVMGKILRDVVLEAWWANQRQTADSPRTGRRPEVVLTAADLIAFLPQRLSSALLPAVRD